MRSILCIDLKSFYASCECLLTGENPFTTALVVASKKQGKGAITLAVTPYMKSLGVKSRGRIYEIPKNIKYEIIEPKMSYYVQKSKEVISVYLDFVSEEDLHVYSVDEAFLDVTNYLSYYKLSDERLGLLILKTIYEKTGLMAACGVGENMFIAKSAMDIDAKKSDLGLAKWSKLEARKKLMDLENLTDMWGIGKNMAKNLNNIGIFSIKDLAMSSESKLTYHFGVIGRELWLHSHAEDDAVISEEKFYQSSVSYGSSQMLFKDYNTSNIKLIIKETIDVLTSRLRKNNKVCKKISLAICYSKDINKGFSHSVSMDIYSRDSKTLYEYALFLLNKYAEDLPIRKLSISLGNITSIGHLQTSLFLDNKKVIKDDDLYKQIDLVKNKYGKNSIVRASALLKDSTVIDRNCKLGGHSV